MLDKLLKERALEANAARERHMAGIVDEPVTEQEVCMLTKNTALAHSHNPTLCLL